MDAELLELQRQFEFAQAAKSSVRLSDRNVVELVQKLQELNILDFDLLHTLSGKEYITPEQLRREIAEEIVKRGRVSVIDLAEITGVDLYHVEKQTQRVVADDPAGTLALVQGEVISQSYWDGIAEEINDRLQECSQIAIADIAAGLNLGSELVSSALQPRLGTLVKGRLEGGQLYTPAYVARVAAMVRGAARGVTVPTNLSPLWGMLQLLLCEIDGASGVAVESSFFQSLFNGSVKEGEVLGSLRAGTHWTPAVFAIAQRECVESLYSQNSFVSYDALQKLGISQPILFLQSRYPEGIPLATAFARPSMIEMVDATIEDAMERGSWIDSLSVLPTSFMFQDASTILSICPSVQAALKANKGLILGDSYVFSSVFVKDIYDRLEKEMGSFNFSRPSGAVLIGDTSWAIDSNETSSERKKKKGKSAGAKATEPVVDDEDHIPTKSKKSQRKGKDASSTQVVAARTGSKKDVAKSQEENSTLPSEEWIIEKILMLAPDFEEQGLVDSDPVLRSLASHMRPKLINHLKEKRKTLFTENAERIKRLLDNLRKKLDESYLNMQLYEKALDLFEDDQSTSIILHRHLLRTVAASIVDMLFLNLDMDNKLRNGSEVEEPQNMESSSLNITERTALAKSFPGSLSRKALALAESLEGKQVEAFMTALREVAEESGFSLKKLDKKLERNLLHSYRKDLTSQVTTEIDPVALLPKVVSLLYIKVNNKALQAPGRAISAAVSRLKDKLDESAFKTLTDYQAATVSLLSLQAAATGDEEDCTSDRIMSQRELLESLMPELKGLVLNA